LASAPLVQLSSLGGCTGKYPVVVLPPLCAGDVGKRMKPKDIGLPHASPLVRENSCN
jgi:hypothetical protein